MTDNNPNCSPDHAHGVRTTCYYRHGCKCDPCRELVTERYGAKKRGEPNIVPCMRCGIPRVTNHARLLRPCRDCRDVLSQEEREVWAA